MANPIDPEILLGFVDEARGYLPQILESIDALRRDSDANEHLAETHRLTHSIKGAASMLGLTGLANIAFLLEESLEQLAAGQLIQDADAIEVLSDTAGTIGRYLDQLVSGHLQEGRLIRQTVLAHRRLRGLPLGGDEAEVERLTPETETRIDFPAAQAAASQVESAPPPSRSAAASPRRPQPAADAPSPELLAAFQEEAQDHLAKAGQALRHLQRQPDDGETLRRVRRTMHTLKGAAAMVGHADAADLSHRMEDLLDHMTSLAEPATAEHLDVLFATLDGLEDLLLRTDPAADPVDLETLYERYLQLLDGPSDSQPPEADDPVAQLTAPPSTPSAASQGLGQVPILDLQPQGSSGAAPLAAAPSLTAAAESQGPTVRVPMARLDEVVRLVSELVVSNSTFERTLRQLAKEVGELSHSTGQLKRLSQRFESATEAFALQRAPAAALAEVPRVMAAGGATAAVLAPSGPSSLAWAEHSGFDELEMDRYTEVHRMSRQLGESSNDLGTLQNGLKQRLGDFESHLNRTSRLNGEIQDKLMRLRMVPLGQLSSRLHRTVRNAAQKAGKQVDLQIEGEQTALDKTVLEDIQDPLLHILRNAVSHGIEDPEQRAALKKEVRGRIRLRAYHEGTQVVLEVSDDGGGIDLESLRAKAIEGSWMDASQAAQASPETLYGLLFQPGFSTAPEVDDISGRGVGLDVVQATVQRLEGTTSIRSSLGEGSTLTIRLPLTLAVMRAVLVSSGEQTYALPLAPVRQLLRLDADDLERLGKEPVVRVRDQTYPAIRLSQVLGHPTEEEDDSRRRMPALILDLGARQVALLVDRIVEARDIVVKNLGSLLRQVPAVTGATLMGDGSVVLILNPNDLEPEVQRVVPAFQPPVVAPSRRPEAAPVLVVDDSVSVRRVLSNLLKSQGWQPLTARDGVEALEVLQSAPQQPGAILLDIEMPRMDGYELTAILRSRDAHKDLPIIMLTSRSGDKHRQRAFELGVSEYLVKPFQDHVLLGALRRLQRGPRPGGSATP